MSNLPADKPYGLTEAVAFGAGSALFVTACNAAVPFIGAATAGAAIAAAGYNLAKRKVDQLEPAAEARVEELIEAALTARTLTSAAPAARAWEDWLPWEELQAGTHAPVPVGLPHPTEAGFRRTRLAKNCGQVADWVHPLTDGSRLHAHEYADDSLTVHRDRLDPSLGPGTASIHWLTETREGNAVTGLVAAGIGGVVAWLLLSEGT